MSDQPFTPPPAFKYAFKPAEQVPESDYHRFERYTPRVEGETDDAYATRLEKLGLAVKVKSEDARDVVGFKATMQMATARGVPLALITCAARSLPTPEDLARSDAAKAAYLDAARRAAN